MRNSVESVEKLLSVSPQESIGSGVSRRQLSLDDQFKSGRSQSDIADAISQFLSREPFLSAGILAKRLATSSHTMKKILTRDEGMRKFTRRWVPHDLSATEKAKRVVDGWMLVEALRNDESQDFSHIMTRDES
jgi:dTDP-4-dehydrorhamnose reductase